MLIRYKKSYEKIAMGLLSLIPSEKEIKTLMKTIRNYEEKDDWQLFLWKDGDDVIGVIGVQMKNENEAIIHHISVNPSFRSEGIGREIIVALERTLGENIHVSPSDRLTTFYENCFHNDQKETGE